MAAHHIVVVGGGAGGLVLATRLGDRLGKHGKARITLIDAGLTHVWKPLLHEIAAGTLSSDVDSVKYLGHATAHHFRFEPGRMDGLDRAARKVSLAPQIDARGRQSVPARTVSYDTLVIAVGGVSNDFGIAGVGQHCVYLDDHRQADALQQRLLTDFLRAQVQPEPLREGQLQIAIVGAGATGVELAAELHRAARLLVAHGLDRIDPERDIKITLIEAAAAVLPALPERVQEATAEKLHALGIAVLTGEQVLEVTEDAIRTASGKVIPAELKIWCAGVCAPAFLHELDGLETDRGARLVVDDTLRVTRDEHIFALGDCACCPQPGSDRPVPPRAQAAHQQAITLADSLTRRLEGRPPKRFVYNDHGSLISLSYSAVGNLMGNLWGTVTIEGALARLTYLSLYRRHQMALHGIAWVIQATLARILARGTRPQLKLH
jgi:NADH dehydrogenase